MIGIFSTKIASRLLELHNYLKYGANNAEDKGKSDEIY